MNVGVDVGSSAVKVATSAGVVSLRGLRDPEVSARMGTTAPIVRHVGDALSLCSPHEAYVLAVSRALGETSIAENVTVVVPDWWSPRAKDLVTQTLAALLPGSARLVGTGPAASRMLRSSQYVHDPAIAVLDIGATCTSATVVIEDGSAEPQVAGRPVVLAARGGDHLDALLFHHVLGTIVAGGSPGDRSDPQLIRAARSLLDDLRHVKEQFSTRPVVQFTSHLPGSPAGVRLVRAELDEVARPVVEEIVGMLAHCIAECGTDVGAVALVGGGAPMPLLAQMISGELGMPVLLDDEPASTAARGAMQFAVRRPEPAKRPRARGARRDGQDSRGVGSPERIAPTARIVDISSAVAGSIGVVETEVDALQAPPTREERLVEFDHGEFDVTQTAPEHVADVEPVESTGQEPEPVADVEPAVAVALEPESEPVKRPRGRAAWKAARESRRGGTAAEIPPPVAAPAFVSDSVVVESEPSYWVPEPVRVVAKPPSEPEAGADVEPDVAVAPESKPSYWVPEPVGVAVKPLPPEPVAVVEEPLPTEPAPVAEVESDVAVALEPELVSEPEPESVKRPRRRAARKAERESRRAAAATEAPSPVAPVNEADAVAVDSEVPLPVAESVEVVEESLPPEPEAVALAPEPEPEPEAEPEPEPELESVKRPRRRAARKAERKSRRAAAATEAPSPVAPANEADAVAVDPEAPLPVAESVEVVEESLPSEPVAVVEEPAEPEPELVVTLAPEPEPEPELESVKRPRRRAARKAERKSRRAAAAAEIPTTPAAPLNETDAVAVDSEAPLPVAEPFEVVEESVPSEPAGVVEEPAEPEPDPEPAVAVAPEPEPELVSESSSESVKRPRRRAARKAERKSRRAAAEEVPPTPVAPVNATDAVAADSEVSQPVAEPIAMDDEPWPPAPVAMDEAADPEALKEEVLSGLPTVSGIASEGEEPEELELEEPGSAAARAASQVALLLEFLKSPSPETAVPPPFVDIAPLPAATPSDEEPVSPDQPRPGRRYEGRRRSTDVPPNSGTSESDPPGPEPDPVPEAGTHRAPR